MAVLEPRDGEVRYFISYVLLFGATGSVMAFNRAARALREIMQRFLMLPAINYFDDFPHVDLDGMVVRSQVVMEEAFRVMGPRRTPPARKFVVLGVVVDLAQSHDKVVVVRNKEDRVEELEATWRHCMSSHQPQQLRCTEGSTLLRRSAAGDGWLR